VTYKHTAGGETQTHGQHGELISLLVFSSKQGKYAKNGSLQDYSLPNNFQKHFFYPNFADENHLSKQD
jgi:hypothetical protein